MKFTQDLTKYFDYHVIEKKWYDFWEKNQLFHVDVNSEKTPFVILMPPPNVTGILHMGHGLQDTIQDTLIRYKKMKNFNSLWQPGKDHAGIATQNVVEKMLSKEKIRKEDLGRDKFVDRVWEVVNDHRNTISNQKKRLGDFADWTKDVFTLDPAYYKAVMTAFVKLYNKGLIYKGKYIVNWCPRCHTAISNEEVDFINKKSHLWYIKYPIEGTGEYLAVATTRPETMLGDTGIAVNPDDQRFSHLIGKRIMLPLVNRYIPVIADPLVDKNFGTGAVKVTPSHDPNDFEMGQKHGLEFITVIDSKGYMNENCPEKYRGLSREEARDQVIRDLEKEGFLEKIEDYTHSVGHCSRCNTVIEPYLSDQWFVKMKPLAKPALEVVRSGKLKIYPQRWEKIYFDWLENIRDWCISRQLWWGHRIPVYYCDDCSHQFASVDKPEICPKCGSSNISQDEDVLDTWFSSWLWPFATQGWPEKTRRLDNFFPTDVLVSGYDILFFWVSKMVMASCEFMDDIPFKDIYLTGLIRDKYGRKMSKSLGNGIDPLDMIEQYGADAMRFTLTYLCTEGQDINLDPKKFEMGRNFINKLWNAFKFSYPFFEGNIEQSFNLNERNNNFDFSDKWIIHNLNELKGRIEDYFVRYKIQYIANDIYQFVWHDFCDWYIECAKMDLNTGDNKKIKHKANMLYSLLKEIILVIHPIMPFVSEELYHFISEDKQSVILNDYPVKNSAIEYSKEAQDFEYIKNSVIQIRNVRQELNIPLSQSRVYLNPLNERAYALFSENSDLIKSLTKIEEISFIKGKPEFKFALGVTTETEVFFKIEGIIDIEQEIARIESELAKIQDDHSRTMQKLNNKNFMEKAKQEAVDKELEKKHEFEIKIHALKDKLNMLK